VVGDVVRGDGAASPAGGGDYTPAGSRRVGF